MGRTGTVEYIRMIDHPDHIFINSSTKRRIVAQNRTLHGRYITSEKSTGRAMKLPQQFRDLAVVVK